VRSLAEQMNLPAEQLSAHCRFESDIATPPPAGAVALSFDDGPEPGASEPSWRCWTNTRCRPASS
jgi:peptidoglycan/xylan/chitin deacetylase (PgdA/CDA1 family)